jgi:acyl transferase domain-containing protein/acyl carrier protein
LLKPLLGLDLRHLIFPTEERAEGAARQLDQTSITQPALFVIEYALARMWMAWGVRPQAMIGHSIGEYVAACLSGVFSLNDALALVSKRAKLMQSLPGGVMLAVPMAEDHVRELAGDELCVAAVNRPGRCVVSGPAQAIAEFERKLTGRGETCQRLSTSHAFHSRMMEPILEPFTRQVEEVKLNPPEIPYLSNVTGDWITAQEATDPKYWARHLRQTVRFADGLRVLMSRPAQALLEVGPGRVLTTLAQQSANGGQRPVAISSLRQAREKESDEEYLMKSVAKLWLAGVSIEWDKFHEGEGCGRIPLPTYPFERQRYWVERRHDEPAGSSAESGKRQEVAEWFYVPTWKRALPPAVGQSDDRPRSWLVFGDECGVGAAIITRLRLRGQEVVEVYAGHGFAKSGGQEYTINPGRKEDYYALFENLQAAGKLPHRVVHLWGVTAGDTGIDDCLRASFYSPLWLAQAIGRQAITSPIEIAIVSNDMQEVSGEEPLQPGKATALGPAKVMQQEYPNVTCRSIDVVIGEGQGAWLKRVAEQVIGEFGADQAEKVVAYRGKHRWVESYEAARPEVQAKGGEGLRPRGVYVITGGLGDIGHTFAEYLAREVKARLVLIGRSRLPEREDWDGWLAGHGQEDETGIKIKRVRALESLGAEVMAVSCDVADEDQVRAAFGRALDRFGRIDGVIYAAGLAERQRATPIQQASQSDCELHFQPKVRGLMVLERVIGRTEMDFCMLVSSLSSVLGGLGFAAYSAANLFMDAFARKQNQAGHTRWVSVNWDAWRFKEDGQQSTAFGAALAELAITPAEGVRAFEHLLSMRTATQVVVSTAGLQARIDQWVRLERAKTQDSQPLHPRPNLQNDYVRPDNELERRIAGIWQRVLSVEQVGINDSFFELGGDSLTALQLINEFKQEFGVQVPVVSIFERPTISSLAAILNPDRGENPRLASRQDRGARRREKRRGRNRNLDSLDVELELRG